MKRITALLAAASIALALSGCTTQNDEVVCKKYFEELGTYFAGMINGSSGEVEFAEAHRTLANEASGDLKTALLTDAEAVPDGVATMQICKQFLTE